MRNLRRKHVFLLFVTRNVVPQSRRIYAERVKPVQGNVVNPVTGGGKRDPIDSRIGSHALLVLLTIDLDGSSKNLGVSVPRVSHVL